MIQVVTHVWELLAGSIVFAWILMYAPGAKQHFILTHFVALLAIGGTAAIGWSFGGIWIATFEPFGTLLPGVCLAASAKRAKLWRYPPISRVEKLCAAVLIMCVAVGTLDVFGPVSYAWFYAGWAPAALACALAFWAAWRGQMHVLICVVLAQVFWLMDVGSSNFFDHLSHALLVPALVISAMTFRVSRRSGGT